MELLIGEYEVTYDHDPLLLLVHHLIRGRDVVRFEGDEVHRFRALLAEQGKRIRALGDYQVIFGTADDLSIYLAGGGPRACYFNADQIVRLRDMLEIG